MTCQKCGGEVTRTEGGKFLTHGIPSKDADHYPSI